jgi:hypothetical protein
MDFCERELGKKKIGIVTLALANVDYWSHAAAMTFVYRCGRECPDYEFGLLTPERMAIDQARNFCIRLGQHENYDAYFFFDDDTRLSPHVMKRALEKMFEEDVCDIWMPIYFIRGAPYDMMAFVMEGKNQMRSVRDEEWQAKNFDGKVAAVGNGCTLYRANLFEEVPHPWFMTIQGQCTEDIYFFSKLREFYPKYRAYLDTSLDCGHIVGTQEINGSNYKLHRALAILQHPDHREYAMDVVEEVLKRGNRTLKEMREGIKKSLLQEDAFYKGEKKNGNDRADSDSE